ncbi:hypothetical protein CEXT_358591 [Caerostris extrusa]|uniref:Uncharacterized protein n=1 Tax=Caerostris extrusa TaxID=172846 RepID=A0AAV4PA01_CAEEX|nr:hypothetical protein CEXT_358591 [Caerostris extrusa]
MRNHHPKGITAIIKGIINHEEFTTKLNYNHEQGELTSSEKTFSGRISTFVKRHPKKSSMCSQPAEVYTYNDNSLRVSWLLKKKVIVIYAVIDSAVCLLKHYSTFTNIDSQIAPHMHFLFK